MKYASESRENSVISEKQETREETSAQYPSIKIKTFVKVLICKEVSLQRWYRQNS